MKLLEHEVLKPVLLLHYSLFDCVHKIDKSKLNFSALDFSLVRQISSRVSIKRNSCFFLVVIKIVFDTPMKNEFPALLISSPE